MPNGLMPRPGTPTEELRIRFGFRVIIAGFLLVGLTLLVLAAIWMNRGTSSDIKITDLTSVIGTVTGIVGTVVGAFFGVNASGSARDQMNDARKDAQDVSNRALAQLPPEKAASVL